MHAKAFVSYIRVSTSKQQVSGLGLEAQQEAIRQYLNGKGRVLAEHIEIESGRNNRRPELAKALALCKRSGATLVVAKIDRLSRNVAFLANLQESKVDFVATDMPEANRLTIHILAAVAQHEAEMISARTKMALQAAKARGTKLGNPKLKAGTKATAEHARTALSDNANKWRAEMLPEVQKLVSNGANYSEIARTLNEAGERTRRGKQWTACAVSRLLQAA